MRNIIATAVACAGLALIPAPPANADVYDNFFAAADWLAKKYGVVVYVDTRPLDYTTYAQAQGYTITLNSYWAADPAALDANIAYEIETEYSRGRYCSAVQSLAAHEFAHILDNATGHTARGELLQALANGFGGEVSGYALESPGEAIAESFVAVECDVPTPAEQAIYTMLVN
jgi:hypothetical protein